MPVRPQSRNSRPARATSPALSQRSRRSVTSQRRAPPAPRDVTDDEDSDAEFDHGRHKNRREQFTTRRGRKMSVQSNFELPLDVDSDKASERARGSGRFTKTSAKNYRGGSVARSLHDYPITRRDKSPDSVPSSDEEMQKRKYKKEPVLAEMAVQTYGEIGAKPNEVKPKEKTPPIVEVPVKGKVESITHEMVKEWACKHCTYVNDPGTRICGVCCKTAEPLLPESPPPSPEFKRSPGDFNFETIGK